MKRSILWALVLSLSFVSQAHGQTSDASGPAVKGRGTRNFVPLWTSDRSLGNSVLFQSGGNIGVGTTTPHATLDVESNEVYGALFVTSSTTPYAGALSGVATAPTGTAYGVIGQTYSTSFGAGVLGTANSDTGNGFGGFFQAKGSSVGATAVFGYASATSGYTIGVSGFTESPTATAGRFVSHSGSGLLLQGNSGSNFVQVFAVDASGNGYFAGNLNVTGNLSKGSGSFKIDDPLDPANKTLSHSFVESPDMMNIYTGVVKLDAKGAAWVSLPEYFEALNRDFRYQLTAIGAPGPNLYVAQEIAGNRFKIEGGKPGARVSWQVTGVRQDAYANAHRIPVEEDKPSAERGYYLHPDAFGQPRSKGIEVANGSQPGSSVSIDRK